MQVDALTGYGCGLILTEKVTGKTKERPKLAELFGKLRAGDTVVVWKLDRLARSLKDLIDLVSRFQDAGVNFVSMQDNIDTGSASGRFFFHVFGALAEFETDLIKERTIAGLKSARARGRKGGRPRGLSKQAIMKAHAVANLYREKKLTMQQIANELGISRVTCYRYLRYLESTESGKPIR